MILARLLLCVLIYNFFFHRATATEGRTIEAVTYCRGRNFASRKSVKFNKLRNAKLTAVRKVYFHKIIPYAHRRCVALYRKHVTNYIHPEGVELYVIKL